MNFIENSRQKIVDLWFNLYFDRLLSHVHHGDVVSLATVLVIDLFHKFPSLPSYFALFYCALMGSAVACEFEI